MGTKGGTQLRQVCQPSAAQRVGRRSRRHNNKFPKLLGRDLAISSCLTQMTWTKFQVPLRPCVIAKNVERVPSCKSNIGWQCVQPFCVFHLFLNLNIVVHAWTLCSVEAPHLQELAGGNKLNERIVLHSIRYQLSVWDRLKSVGDRVGIGLGSVWDRCGIGLGMVWNRFRIVLGLVCDRFVIGLGSFWDRFGIGLESVWDLFGIGSGLVWDRFGIGLGSVWDRFGIFVRSVRGRFGIGLRYRFGII